MILMELVQSRQICHFHGLLIPRANIINKNDTFTLCYVIRAIPSSRVNSVALLLKLRGGQSTPKHSLHSNTE